MLQQKPTQKMFQQIIKALELEKKIVVVLRYDIFWFLRYDCAKEKVWKRSVSLSDQQQMLIF